MFSSLVVVYREVLEIALILGVLLAATKDLPRRSRWIWGGLGLGAAGSLVVARFTGAISSAAEGMGQELFNALVLLTAAGLIAWTVIWMRLYGRTLTQHFNKVGRSVVRGESHIATLTTVVALAVLREGSEIALFLYGILSAGESAANLLAGSVFGLIGGVVTGVALYYGLVKISPKRLFSVTSWLLIFLAAGMVSQALAFLAAAGWVPETASSVYNASGFLPERAFPGNILHALFGYSERPSAVQFIGYLATIGAIVLIMKLSELRIRNSANKAAAVLLLLLAASWAAPSSSFATNKVYSPIIEQGEFELETRGGLDIDDEAEKDGAVKQKFAAGYGVTDFWFTEVYGEIEIESRSEDDREYEFTAVEWENRFQILPQGQYWLDAGLYFAYEWAVEDGHADKIEGKVLIEKETGPLVHDLNYILEKEVGDDAEEELEWGLAWATRWRLHPAFEPGVELHMDFGEFEAKHSFDEGKHFLGPVIAGAVGPMSYNAGYLFGLSDAAPDGRLKWIVELGWYF